MHQSRDLLAYRTHPRERERVSRLFDLIPPRGPNALDVGARDGHLSLLLAERFEQVVALDLTLPPVSHPRVQPVQADASALPYADGAFHTVICAEVLEHIPPKLLPQVCREIVRVTSHCAVIGVPYRQDLRAGCATCQHCGAVNPPWGHVNSFDERALIGLMQGLAPVRQDFVGRTREVTNALTVALLRFAGNPYGSYGQEEGCIECGVKLQPPPERTLMQKVATRVAVTGQRLQTAFAPWRPSWLHVRFDKVRDRATVSAVERSVGGSAGARPGTGLLHTHHG